MFVWLVGFLTPSSTTKLYRGRVPRLTCDNFTCYLTRDSGETMTSVSAGHIILTPTKPIGSGRGSNPGPPHQELRALRTGLSRPLFSLPSLEVCYPRSFTSPRRHRDLLYRVAIRATFRYHFRNDTFNSSNSTTNSICP